MSQNSLRLTYIGHSTLLVELDGVRILTDPVLRNRVAHLRRYGPPPEPAWTESIDAVLISHLHLDHCDMPSLRRLGKDSRLIVPRGARPLFRRRGFRAVEEMSPGEATPVGSLSVSATFAEHSGFHPPSGPTAIALGFLIAGSRRIYFAGDTDLFPGMAELSPGLDVALLPIWGWGRKLGEGHLDPERAARALQLLRPQVCVPIHWGTFGVISVHRRSSPFLTQPPQLFAEEAARLAPEVTVRIVQPGTSVELFR